ncbi:MAG: PadR family transcriptional regulator [Candidatus Micrarchaeia archaeon]
MGGGHCRCGPFSIDVIPKGILKPLILKLISEKPMHGFELMEQIFERTNGFWRPGPAAIYPALEWLEAKGYIRQVDSSAKPEKARNEYEITEEGLKVLDEYERSSKSIEELMHRFSSIYKGF